MVHRFATTFGVVVVLTAAATIPTIAQPDEACHIGPEPPVFAGESENDARLHPADLDAAPHHGWHGQAMFGEETVYLSHLPVFMGMPEVHPHNFQVVLEVEFDDPDDEATYQEIRHTNPGTLYTALPPEFDQSMLVASGPGAEPLRDLPATRVDRGHFERDGVTILNSDLSIERVVYFREFLVDGERLDTQHYLLFGRGDEIFLSHLVSAPPDFDQILSVSLEATEVPEFPSAVIDKIADGLYLNLPDRQAGEAGRLQAGETVTCTLESGTRAPPVTADIQVTDEIFCEAGELDQLVFEDFNDFRSCAE